MNTADYMKDKELCDDMLTAQKHITANYSIFANECEHDSLRNDMLSILKEEHTIQAQLFSDMQAHGWYQTCPAEQQKIDNAKNKYRSSVNG